MLMKVIFKICQNGNPINIFKFLQEFRLRKCYVLRNLGEKNAQMNRFCISHLVLPNPCPLISQESLKLNYNS